MYKYLKLLPMVQLCKIMKFVFKIIEIIKIKYVIHVNVHNLWTRKILNYYESL